MFRAMARSLTLLVFCAISLGGKSQAFAQTKSTAKSLRASGGEDWIAPMAKVHARFRGTPGTFAQFGDSITVTRAFWSPLAYGPRGLDEAATKAHARVKAYQQLDCWSKWKGADYGSEGGMTIRWARENVDRWLKKLNPEAVLIMFGTNDLTQLDVQEYTAKTREVAQRCLDNGSVVILSTIPPRSGLLDKSREFAEAVRSLGKELNVPVVDYFGEVLRRRPDDWDGTLAKFKETPGDEYQTPTLICRDGVHPSNPSKFQSYDEAGLKSNGYLLRNYLVLHAYAAVIDKVLDPKRLDPLRKAATFYASFDEAVRGDRGGGTLLPGTRFNDPAKPGQFVFEKGINGDVFRVAKDRGVAGGALEAVDVLPRNGRIYFPAKGNIAYRAGGWSGAVSFWINTDPNKLLKTKFCDPIQITQKGANNGGLWVDFNDAKPRDFRHGAFPAVPEGKTPIKEEDPAAPLVRVKGVDWKAGTTADCWHHIVLSWRNFDTGRPNAVSTLYIDGKAAGQIKDREIAMGWDIDRTGIYFAVGYIGLMDELAIFERELSEEEVRALHSQPDALSPLKEWRSAYRSNSERERRVAEATIRLARSEFLETEATRKQEFKAISEGDDFERLLLLWRLPPRSDTPPPAPKFPCDRATAETYQRDYAAWRGLPLTFSNQCYGDIRYCLIPPGTYVMGSPPKEPGRDGGFDETLHEVTITRPFYLACTETSGERFGDFTRPFRYLTDAERNGGGHAHDENAVWKHREGTSLHKPGFHEDYNAGELKDPVVHVSHHDVRQFCQWLQDKHNLPSGWRFGLPTEAEWEWACRAGSGDRYWWGPNEDTTGKVANVGDKSLKSVYPRWPRTIMAMDDGAPFLAEVGSYQANAFGLHDMLGNVWEFCSTRSGPYPRGPVVDPGDLDPKRGFAVRGGGWSNVAADVRCATRNADPPHFAHSNLGFRVALYFP